MTITGSCGKRLLISASNCGPSMPGMRQSLITRSMSSHSSTFSACKPLPAVNTWMPF